MAIPSKNGSQHSRTIQTARECPKTQSDTTTCGQRISDTERRLFALPYRYGGLAIRNPVIAADEEYQASTAITSELTKLIINQIDDVQSIDNTAVELAKERYNM